MNKPPWKDKWRALSDMKAARNAAAGTTSEDTTTDRHGVSVATIERNLIVTDSYHQQQRWAIESWKSLANSYRTQDIMYWQELFPNSEILSQNNVWIGGVALGSPSQNSYEQERNGTQEQNPSASCTVTKAKLSAVFKDVPFQIINKPPSTIIGDQPTT